MIAGVDASQNYPKGLVDLEPADTLLIYTDGLVDAQHFSGERFGRQRVEKAMLDVKDESARDVVNHIFWEMRRFVGLNRRVDDTTIVIVRIDPGARPALKHPD